MYTFAARRRCFASVVGPDKSYNINNYTDFIYIITTCYILVLTTTYVSIIQ